MVAWAVQQPPLAAAPRGKYFYNSIGYVVAGAMVERALGTSFEAAVQAQIFGPLGMTDASWGPQAAAGSSTQPVAHRRQTDGSWSVLEAFDIPPVFNSSGTMHMSLASWGRFVREVLRVEAGTSTLVPAAVARQTTSTVIATGTGVTYGLGWLITTGSWANGKVLYHSGTNGGNTSLATLAPLRNVAFLVTTNGYDPNGALQILDGMTNRLITFYTAGK
jgi:CubicO group peptidase (beta-lactamase class C family)